MNNGRGGVLFVEPVFDTSGYCSTYVFSESQECYLVDPSESTLKGLLGADGIGLLRTNNILLTSLSWKKIGGLIGVLLSLKETTNIVKIFGPPGIFTFFRNASFHNKSNLFRIYELDDYNYNQIGEIFQIKSIPIHSINTKFIDVPESNSYEFDNNPNENNNNNNNNKYNSFNNNKKNNSENNKNMMKFPVTLNNKKLPTVVPLSKPYNSLFSNNRKDNNYHPKISPNICYLFETLPIRTRFDKEKANSLGVFNGRKYKELTNGFDVVNDLPNGRIVSPNDIYKFVDGTCFAFINCPDESYFDSLFENPIWEPIFSKQKKLSFVYHSSPKEVINNPKFIKFMEKLTNKPTNEEMEQFEIDKKDERLSLEQDNQPTTTKNTEDGSELEISLVFDEFERRSTLQPPIQTKHFLTSKEFSKNQICEIPDLTPTDENNEPTSINVLNELLKSKILKDSFFAVESKAKHIISPVRSRGRITEKNIIKIPPIQHLNLDDKGEKDKATIEHIKNFRNNMEKGLEYPKLMFLGTASASPNLFRSVSGILVSPDENNHMLVDCGQSSISQLEIFFGRKKTKQILMETHLIWVSHLHADHHLGIGSVIIERNLAFKEAGTGAKSLILQEVCAKLSLISLTSVPVVHCNASFGLVATFKNKDIPKGYKITYSGDTRPSKLLVAAGKNSDLLIHEATFTDEYQEDAVAKRHSTFSEALGVAKDMKAKQTILTHFSQRYPSVIRLTQSNNLKIGDNYEPVNTNRPYALAYDLVRFSPSDFSLLQELNFTLDEHITSQEEQSKIKERETINERKKRKLGVTTNENQNEIENKDQNENENENEGEKEREREKEKEKKEKPKTVIKIPKIAKKKVPKFINPNQLMGSEIFYTTTVSSCKMHNINNRNNNYNFIPLKNLNNNNFNINNIISKKSLNILKLIKK
ncbi:hypothetical protein DICPUDRAFT_155078 [Dictyostelium purpureum]|uniref:ribonuclease Z n=1 Tax=Dictyostelium purpureum TaxID=5786 RepID=F0ZT10_DICPU|nr:uncharacterized protein DICPUDRAFT_155078 [Dictyostelium purpureum]EGC32915.1 hypothetical protein DICPUDRAFT_155078 [Dictyostelium purpureum]|eukprot:XP_003290563.1 hypothetical protein DICPUDRAFT_155078 [Dictyostelium purpureum]